VFGATASVHRHLHGPAVDYVGLAAAAGASWAGVPGPGEPVLIAAAVYAARHRLDITEVLIVAFVARCWGIVAGCLGRSAVAGAGDRAGAAAARACWPWPAALCSSAIR
jgi:membrane protein DedA with SNARE-associated domain